MLAVKALMNWHPTELPPEALAFLTERHLATLSIPRRGRSPHVTPVGFTWDDDASIARVITFADAHKVKLIQNLTQKAEGGRAAEGGKLAEGGKAVEGGKAAEGGKVAEAGRAAEGGKLAEGGKVAEAGKLAEGGKVAEATEMVQAAQVALCQVDGGRWLALEGEARVHSEKSRCAEGVRRYAERYRPPKDRGDDRRVIEISVQRVSGRV